MNATISRTLNEMLDSALFDASKERRDLNIRRLCEEIDEKNLVLPVFQTYIRWTDEKAAGLFNYQLHGSSPIAPISVNIITKPEKVVEQMNFITREILDGESLKGRMSVADGQQRLSANYKAYTNHPEFKHIVLDLKKGKFVVIDEGREYEEYQIPVGILYNKEHTVFREYLTKNEFLNQSEVKDVLSEIRRKHFGYAYVVNQATDLSRQEQMAWFEVLNLAGSQVTEVMVYLSDMLTKGLDFYTYYVYPFAEKLESNGFERLFPRKSAEVSIPLAALNSAYYKHTGLPKTSNSSPIPSDAKPKAIGKLETVDTIQIIDMNLEAMDNVLRFLKVNETELKPIERLDLITYLIGLFVEANVKEIDNNQKEFLINWCNEVDFVNNSNKLRREKFDELIRNYLAL
ncbi:DUF262 domain-containing protein [Alteribacter aurantiacus]|uniref:DUF262 domain-containing protein n=1 Tax=Alteribacter aurantiacus TaxID=254410 RepID=UPI0004230C72|nr:DUF262 domain-containing protein [Alteribacter aurantiacus]